MPPSGVPESTVESVALGWLASLGWTVLQGPDIAPDTDGGGTRGLQRGRAEQRLRSALVQLNPNRPDDALDDALSRLTRPPGATLEARNDDFHRMAVAGLDVEYPDTDGRVRGDKGLPLGVIELKNPADENATISSAFHQLQTYKAEIPSLFTFNAALVVSGRAGSAHRRADGRAGVVQAVAHDRGRDAGRPEPAAAPGAARGRLQPAPAARPGPRLHRVRGRRQRRPGQEDGRISPVPRGADRRRRDAAGGSVAAGGGRSRPGGPLRVAPPAGRRPRRPPDRRGLAHPGVGQEPDDGVLRRPHHARSGHGESHRRRADGPQRPRRPTVHHLFALRRPARAAARPGREPRRPAGEARGRIGRRGVHDDPEVLPRRARGRGARGGRPLADNSSTRGQPLARDRRSASGPPLTGNSRATGIRCCRAGATSW